MKKAIILSPTNHHLLTPGQFGHVPGCNAIQPTIIEELQYEISRGSQHPLVHLNFNATACYDCIILSLSGLMCCSYGQHHFLVFIAACTLLKAVYVLKTQLGVSESFYKYSELSPIYEQAKALATPLYFGAISAPFYSISMNNVLKVLTFYPDGSVVVWIYMISFVDNTSEWFYATPCFTS